MAYSSADVPSAFDVWINDTGYIFARDTDSSYFSRHTIYGQTPTFVERQNVSGDYGDNQQMFYMIQSQNDFSGGSGQHFFKVGDAASDSKYYQNRGTDTDTPGQITIEYPIVSPIGASLVAICGRGDDSDQSGFWAVSSTTLFYISSSGTITSKGAHGSTSVLSFGLAASPGAAKGKDIVFIGGDRYFDENAGTFAAFSATSGYNLCYLNNTLYGYRPADGTLSSFSTTGTATVLFTWKNPLGTAFLVDGGQLCAYGGKLAIIIPYVGGSQLWIYDGSATSLAAKLPPNSLALGCAANGGYIGIPAVFFGSSSDPIQYELWVWDGSSISREWFEDTKTPTALTDLRTMMASYSPGIAPYKRGFAFCFSYTDYFGGSAGEAAIRYFEPSTGYTRVLCISVGQSQLVASSGGSIFFTASGTGQVFPGSSLASASGSIILSTFDANSSLTKIWKGIKIDGVAGTGGTVDIYYALDDPRFSGLGPLQTNAAYGTEYAINQTSQRITVGLQLNGDVGGDTPIVTRVFVRGVPVQDTFRRVTYVLDMSGNKNASVPNYVTLKNGASYDLDGDEMRDKLIAAMQATAPFTIKDRVGSFTGIIEPDTVQIEEIRSDYGRGEYKAWVTVREV